eukprot:TRINITY_DN8402_c0_g1_i1.p1 TRINITY_DN8402_c0_g1~~TRINITY_DN8402_c0_g1_i1.p1  ORF type:complete len:747 (-),score=164.44 TRINITY_DN8402_c0_g1_i1:836-3076(-)
MMAHIAHKGLRPRSDSGIDMKNAERYLTKVNVQDVIGIGTAGMRDEKTDASLARYILHRSNTEARVKQILQTVPGQTEPPPDVARMGNDDSSSEEEEHSASSRLGFTARELAGMTGSEIWRAYNRAKRQQKVSKQSAALQLRLKELKVGDLRPNFEDIRFPQTELKQAVERQKAVKAGRSLIHLEEQETLAAEFPPYQAPTDPAAKSVRWQRAITKMTLLNHPKGKKSAKAGAASDIDVVNTQVQTFLGRRIDRRTGKYQWRRVKKRLPTVEHGGIAESLYSTLPTEAAVEQKGRPMSAIDTHKRRRATVMQQQQHSEQPRAHSSVADYFDAPQKQPAAFFLYYHDTFDSKNEKMKQQLRTRLEQRQSSSDEGYRSSCMLSKAAQRLEHELNASTGVRVHSPLRSRLTAVGVPDSQPLSEAELRALSPSIWQTAIDDAMADKASLPSRREFYRRLLDYIHSKGGIKHHAEQYTLTQVRNNLIRGMAVDKLFFLDIFEKVATMGLKMLKSQRVMNIVHFIRTETDISTRQFYNLLACVKTIPASTTEGEPVVQIDHQVLVNQLLSANWEKKPRRPAVDQLDLRRVTHNLWRPTADEGGLQGPQVSPQGNTVLAALMPTYDERRGTFKSDSELVGLNPILATRGDITLPNIWSSTSTQGQSPRDMLEMSDAGTPQTQHAPIVFDDEWNEPVRDRVGSAFSKSSITPPSLPSMKMSQQSRRFSQSSRYSVMTPIANPVLTRIRRQAELK